MHIECHKNKLLFYKKRDLLSPEEIKNAITFVEALVKMESEPVAQPA